MRFISLKFNNRDRALKLINNSDYIILLPELLPLIQTSQTEYLGTCPKCKKKESLYFDTKRLACMDVY